MVKKSVGAPDGMGLTAILTVKENTLRKAKPKNKEGFHS